MKADAHEALCHALDDDEAAVDGADGQQQSAEQLAALLQVEHEARLKAEAIADNHVQRLAVHSQQVSEYALQKATDFDEIRKQASELHDLADSINGAMPLDVSTKLKRLYKYIQDAADDAHAFSAQAASDAKRHQLGPPAGTTTEGDAHCQSDVVEHTNAVPEQDKASMADVEEVPDVEQPPPLSTGQSTDAMDAEDEPGSPEAPEATPAPAAASNGPPVAAVAAPPMAIVPAARSATASFAELATYTPMRLTLPERRLFRLLEAALTVSDYTDKVDILTWKRGNGRIVQQVKDICSILSGLVVAQDYRRGQELVKNRDFKQNEAFFKAVFEVGRRYKIMNPDRMRATYGKLLYMLMDTTNENVAELLEFSCVSPLLTVRKFLEAAGAGAVLDDPRLEIATAEINGSPDRPRAAIQADLARKEAARKALARAHATNQCPPDDLLSAVYSLADHHTYLLYNRDPVERMIEYLQMYFQPRKIDGNWSLAISSGRGGARLSHNHERQYAYVLQSLSLWSEIAADMFKLWYLSEQDLLSKKTQYRLQDTGQGLNRVQSAPLVGRAMADILRRCQTKVGSWVGSSVVHLGDSNVPNALMFIDKYTQVPRILNPLVRVLDELPRLAARDAKVAAYIDSAFDSAEDCRKLICLDFFRHAFDGSGADNFFDAGSCIDGRLTSAWNWCAKVEKKPYYIVFKMAGFFGFDGEFR